MTLWERAQLAITLLAIDPHRLGGLVIRARAGPAQAAMLAAVQSLDLAKVKLQHHMTVEVLNGDIDLTASLAGRQLVTRKSIFDCAPSLFILPMAERSAPQFSARICQALEEGRGHALLALDEGVEVGDGLPDALTDRLAFHITLEDLALQDLSPMILPRSLEDIRAAVRGVTLPADVMEEAVILAASLGISSLRAPLLLGYAAQAHAALHARYEVTEEDLKLAVMLVYPHRATRLPQDPEPEAPSEQTNPAEAPQDPNQAIPPNDLMIEAVKAVLPPGVLAQLQTVVKQPASGSGSGARRKGNHRGRPLPARLGPKNSGARVDLVASLRAAIPWQTLRKTANPEAVGPIFKASDLRHKRYEIGSDRLLIFTVDASGSAAVARLAEAKGAVELLLGEAYARRDHVALYAFRGTGSEALLPPTRSLVQTKKRLAALPGGGATPLAAGLAAAFQLALQERRNGLTPTLILLTDGRANVALDGSNDRAQAAADALMLAQKIAEAQIPALVIDTTIRPEKTLQTLAGKMRAHYIALPRSDAKSVSGAVSSALAHS
uniref:Mg-protoporphyrin IX chelatase n=1 Tax=uncultured marine proteobacterium TaxID=482892 RepID=Q8KZ31_9PROT|nr:magnesium-protoporphyrin IX chelatase, BchD subunit [uncultured marine proteobacterium]